VRTYHFLIAGTFLVASSILSFQGQAPTGQGLQTRVSLSPVPLWPADGVIPNELAQQYVFYDVNAEEYVVAYPENIETEDFAKNPGKLIVQRFA